MNNAAMPDEILLSKNIDYMAAFGLGKSLLDSQSLNLYAVTPSDWDQTVVNSNIFSPDSKRNALTLIGAEPIATSANQSYATRQFYGSTAGDPGVRFVASGQMPMGLFVRYTSDFDGEVKVNLNGQLIHEMQASNILEQQSVACFQPKAGTNQVAFTMIPDSNVPQKDLEFRDLRFVSPNILDIGMIADSHLIGDCDTRSRTDMSRLKGTVGPHLLRWVFYPDVGHRLRSVFYDSSGDNVAALARVTTRLRGQE